MLDMFNYGVTEQHREIPTEDGQRSPNKTRAIRGGVAVREFLHKQGLAFGVATGVCAAVTWSEPLGYAALALFAAGAVLNAFVTKKLYDWGLRQVAVRVQYMCAVESDDE